MDLETVQHHGLGDHHLMDLGWTVEPPGLKLLLSRDVQEGEIVELRFAWVSDLKVNLDFSEYDGIPFVFESELKKLENDMGWRFTLTFDGTPVGEISLTCSEVHVRRLM
jgi:hypothetical protein